MVLLLAPSFYHHIIFATRIAYLPSLYHTLYSHTIFPAFISSFPSYSEKNIYLCHTLSAHQRDETGKSGFLFLNGVNNVLFPKSKLSKFHAPGNDTTDTPHR